MRERPPSEAPRRPTNKEKELVVGSPRRPIAAKSAEALRKLVSIAGGSRAPWKPAMDKGNRKVSKTNYVKDRAFVRVEDELENLQIPSLRRSKTDNPKAGLGVRSCDDHDGQIN